MTIRRLSGAAALACGLAATLAGCGGAAEPPDRARAGAERLARAGGTTYYVDAVGGDDGSAGTAPATAWKSFQRLRAVTLHPGDAVRLAQGSIWRDSLVLTGDGATGAAVTVASYAASHGSARPKLVGVRSAAGLSWTPAGGAWPTAVYRADPAASGVADVYWNSSRLARARQPNLGASAPYDTLQSTGGDCAVGLAPSWEGLPMQGSKIVVRAVPWQLEAASISGQAGALAACLAPTAPQAGEGYYLEAQQDSQLAAAQALLDVAGEWWQDGAGVLYVWAPGSANPGSGLLEYSVANGDLDNGILLKSLPGAVVSGIDLDMQVGSGVDLRASPKAQVSDIHASRAGRYGVLVEVGNDGATVSGNTVSLAGIDGIKVSGSKVTVSGNVVANTGMVGSALAVVGGGVGVLVSGAGAPASAAIRGNTITDSAGDGLSLPAWTAGAVEANVVQRPCRLLSDCAGIYASGAPPSSAPYGSGTISGNVVSALVADIDGTIATQSSRTQVAGIYLDEYAGRFDVENNAVSNVGAPGDLGMGIFLHKSSDNLVKGNTVWFASRAALRFQSQGYMAGSSTVADVHGNTVVDNRLDAGRYATNPGAGAPPVARVTYAQEWDRFSSPELAFTTDGNVVGHGGAGGANTALTLGARHEVGWLLESASPFADTFEDDLAWDVQTASADAVSVLPTGPLRQLAPTGLGAELVPGADMSSSAWWSRTPSSDPLAFGTCTGAPCATWTPGSPAAAMNGTNFALPAAGLFYFEFHGRATASTARMDIAFPGAAGAMLPRISQAVVPAYEDAYVQAISTPASAGAARVAFTGVRSAATQALQLSSASLRPITGYAAMQPWQEGVLLVNTTASPISVPCAGSGLRSCASLVDSTGAAVVLVGGAIPVPAQSSLVVLVADGAWARP